MVWNSASVIVSLSLLQSKILFQDHPHLSQWVAHHISHSVHEWWAEGPILAALWTLAWGLLPPWMHQYIWKSSSQPLNQVILIQTIPLLFPLCGFWRLPGLCPVCRSRHSNSRGGLFPSTENQDLCNNRSQCLDLDFFPPSLSTSIFKQFYF